MPKYPQFWNTAARRRFPGRLKQAKRGQARAFQNCFATRIENREAPDKTILDTLNIVGTLDINSTIEKT